MEKLFKKNELFFCILLIIIYVASNSYGIQNFGVTDYRVTLINVIFLLILLFLIMILKRFKYYGLCKADNPKRFLYFIPLYLIATVNLWNGISINNSGLEIVFYILTMINVGFIEEIIFRGFLFKAIEKDNINKAIIISALTFGIGHIINLINGADFIPTLMQIIYAIVLGFLFVIIFYKSKSLMPSIVTHSMINALSIFGKKGDSSLYIVSIFLIIISICYLVYIVKNVKE